MRLMGGKAVEGDEMRNENGYTEVEKEMQLSIVEMYVSTISGYI